MAIVTVELFRSDFIASDWELYDKGIKSLSSSMLRTLAKIKYDHGDEVYIYLGKDKHYLKRK